MSSFPATTVKVVSVEPATGNMVRITMEMLVDVNRLAEVSSEMMRTAVKQMKSDSSKKKK